jgi:3-phenylpropionate/trans-cinnamate dioxygenase ferredoxin subunit
MNQPPLVIKKSDVGPVGSCISLETEQGPVAVAHIEDGFFAIEDTCKHMDALLSEGPLEGDILVCPLHGWEYDVRTGKCVAPTWGKMKRDNRGFRIIEKKDELTIILSEGEGEQ